MILADEGYLSYLLPPDDLPSGALDENIISAPWILCVFSVGPHAAMIEIGAAAIEGEILDLNDRFV